MLNALFVNSNYSTNNRGALYSMMVCIILMGFGLMTSNAMAAGVGFVPSTGIWFSSSSFQPNEIVKVYTVVVNNNYPVMNGVVGFYDNDILVGSTEFKGLTKESAKQLSINWVPNQGSHVVQARFMRADAVDDSGKKLTVSLDTLTNISGMPLQVGGGSVAPINTAVVSDERVIGAVSIDVQKKGESLALLPSHTASHEDSAYAANASGGERSNNRGVVETPSALGEGETGLHEVFAQNHALLDKAEGVATTITTTAGRVNAVYSQAKSVVEKGAEYYTVGKDLFKKAEPFVEKGHDAWLQVTDHNDPKRVAMVVGVIVALYVLTRLLFRRRESHPHFEDFE